MSDTQHTPGPWRIGDAGFTVFGPPNPGALPETIAPTKSRANARLIAAAPELLAALQSILDIEPSGLSNDERRLYALARAAIAKATGQ
jgi:hypothetical protein